MIKSILFATTNQRKVTEANLACEKFEIEVNQVSIQLEEIQSAIPSEIARKKIEDAYNKTGKPTVITDTFWNIPALNGFPGGYMKEMAQWLTAQDFINLMEGKTDRRICFTESIYYKDQNQVKSFSNEYWGQITEQPLGESKISIELVAMFDSYTIAQKHNMGLTSHKPEDYIWIEFAKWFSTRE